jgi:hypothetical protein
MARSRISVKPNKNEIFGSKYMHTIEYKLDRQFRLTPSIHQIPFLRLMGPETRLACGTNRDVKGIIFGTDETLNKLDVLPSSRVKFDEFPFRLTIPANVRQFLRPKDIIDLDVYMSFFVINPVSIDASNFILDPMPIDDQSHDVNNAILECISVYRDKNIQAPMFRIMNSRYEKLSDDIVMPLPLPVAYREFRLKKLQNWIRYLKAECMLFTARHGDIDTILCIAIGGVPAGAISRSPYDGHPGDTSWLREITLPDGFDQFKWPLSSITLPDDDADKLKELFGPEGHFASKSR